METIVILDNIRSTHNVGSIFRTADGLGISRIILTGTTPAPVDRFGRVRNDIAKVALGAEKSVIWEYEKEILNVIKKLKKENYKIVAIEQAKNSVDYKKVQIDNPSSKLRTCGLVFIIGEEVAGINKGILKLADIIAEIPMLGKKESLNVSVAFGVAMFRILNI